MLYYCYIHSGQTNEAFTETILASDEDEAYELAYEYGQEHFGSDDIYVDIVRMWGALCYWEKSKNTLIK